MTKKIKFILGTLVLALGFLFCFMFTLSVNSHAEDLEDTTPKQEEVETQKEEKEETDVVVDLFLEHLKDFKWNEAEALFGWIIAYLVANFGVILGFVVTLVLKRLNEAKNSKAFQEALAKVSLENQEKIQNLITEFENQLKEINTENKAFIEEQKAKIEALSNDNTKAVAEELKEVTSLLNK